MSKKIYADLTAVELKQRRAESRVRFAEIYKKTLDAVNLTPNQAPCSRGFEKCWDEIVDLWVSLEYDPIYVAMYHVMWNRYCVDDLTPADMELVTLVEQALIDEGYAFEVWSESGCVAQVFDRLRKMTEYTSSKRQCKTEWFGRYIYAYTYRKVNIKNRQTDDSVWSVGWDDMYMLGSTKGAVEIVDVFEKAICRLVPSAATWTRKEWTDEDAIIKAIHQTHGLDYSQAPRQLDMLLDAFRGVLTKRSYDYSLMLLDEFPTSMEKCLWPRNTEKSMERFFIRICKRSRKYKNPNSNSAYRKDRLMKSWAYRDFNTGKRTSTVDTKKAMFEVEINL